MSADPRWASEHTCSYCFRGQPVGVDPDGDAICADCAEPTAQEENMSDTTKPTAEEMITTVRDLTTEHDTDPVSKLLRNLADALEAEHGRIASSAYMQRIVAEKETALADAWSDGYELGYADAYEHDSHKPERNPYKPVAPSVTPGGEEQRRNEMNQLAAFRDTVDIAALRGMPELPEGPFGLKHLRDMLATVEAGEYSDAKLGRWLGWAQCAVASSGVATLDEMKKPERLSRR